MAPAWLAVSNMKPATGRCWCRWRCWPVRAGADGGGAAAGAAITAAAAEAAAAAAAAEAAEAATAAGPRFHFQTSPAPATTPCCEAALS